MSDPKPPIHETPEYDDSIESPQRGGNAFGVSGFVVSIIGLLTCGGLSVFSLPLTIAGLRREPRGIAVAGFILSLLGIVILSMTGGMMLNGILTVQSFQVANLLAPPANQGQKEETALLLQMTTIRIGQKWKAEGHPPEQAAGDVIATTKIDGWGRPIQYETDGESFSLISFGADGISSTDDVRLGPFTSAEAAYEAYGIDLSK